MSTNQFHRLALLQYVLLQHNLQEVQDTQDQIDSLRDQIASRHKKHRRCDKEIEKPFHCDHCQRVYATDVALRLHLKLKHRGALSVKSDKSEKTREDRTVHFGDSDKENVEINF